MHLLTMHLTDEQMESAEENVREMVSRCMDSNLRAEDEYQLVSILFPTGLYHLFADQYPARRFGNRDMINKYINNCVGPSQLRKLERDIKHILGLKKPNYVLVADKASVLAGATCNRKITEDFDIFKHELFPYVFTNVLDLSVTEIGNVYGDYDNIKNFTPDSFFVAVVDIYS